MTFSETDIKIYQSLHELLHAKVNGPLNVKQHVVYGRGGILLLNQVLTFPGLNENKKRTCTK